MHGGSSPLCPLTSTLNVIGGKWHLIVLYALAQQPRRFNGLQRLTRLRCQALIRSGAPSTGGARINR